MFQWPLPVPRNIINAQVSLYLLCWLCLLLTGSMQAGTTTPVNSATVISDDAVTTIDIASQLEVSKAQEQELNPQQLDSPPYNDRFIPNTTAVTNYGFNDNDAWIRFEHLLKLIRQYCPVQ